MPECIRRVEENTAGGYSAFMASHTLQGAVLRNLQTMAESTQRLSPFIRAAAPSVVWIALSGFRNVLVHNYLGIELDRIWTIIQHDVPTLKAALNATTH
ncbi:MAG TPA: HepT-like ribonuclease domain-containing protein [Longimicrobium sp.]